MAQDFQFGIELAPTSPEQTTILMSGFDIESLTISAQTVSTGQQKAKYSSDVAGALGSNPIFEIRVGGVVKYRTVIPGTLTGTSSGIAFPNQMTEPASVNVADPLTSNAIVAIRNASNPAIEISVPVKVGGAAGYLNASNALSGSDPVRFNQFVLGAPSTLDTGSTTPPPAPPSAGWLEVALTDMRKDPATGTYSYVQSYATNEAKWYLRTRLNYSSQYERAQLTMGRYPNPNAFTTTNPDYQNELSYVSAGNAARTWPNWKGLMWWAQLCLSEAFAANANKHAAGYQNNTRVVIWDIQVWIKLASTGNWSRQINVNVPSGEAWYPDFTSGLTESLPGYDARIETGTGLKSFRTTPSTGVASDGLYRVQHPYGGLTSYPHTDVGEVLASCRAALVLHDSTGSDDRDASRFMLSTGADYYPETTPGSGLPYYFGVGTSRLKYVRAKFPSFQYHVMHTASWASLAASYPDVGAPVPVNAPVAAAPPKASVNVTKNTPVVVAAGARLVEAPAASISVAKFTPTVDLGGGAVALVGSPKTSASGGSGTSTTLSATWNLSSTGRSLIALVHWEGSTTSPTVTDVAGNSWTAGTKRTSVTNAMYNQMFWCLNTTATSASENVTASWGGTSVDVPSLIVYEFSGAMTLTDEDTIQVAADNTLTMPTMTVSGAGVAIASAGSWNAQPTWTAGAGYTQTDVANAGNVYHAGHYKITSAAGTEAPSIPTAGGSNLMLAGATFAASGGGSSWTPNSEAGLIAWFDMTNPASLNTTAKTWTARWGSLGMVSTSGTGPSKITNGFSTTNKDAAVFTFSTDTDLKILSPGFTEVTFVIVMRLNVGAGVFPPVWSRASGLGVSGLMAFDYGGLSARYQNSTNAAETSGSYTYPTDFIVVSRHSSAQRIVRVNGTQDGINSVANTGTVPTTTEDFLLFPYPGSAQTMTAQVAAVGLFTNASWSTTFAEKIEGYVAHQGIGVSTSILPIGHTYKSSAP
jgi:hypothetical protein